MFGVPKHLALIMAIKRNNLMSKTFIKHHKAHFQTGPKKFGKMTKKCKKCEKNAKMQHFGPKNS